MKHVTAPVLKAARVASADSLARFGLAVVGACTAVYASTSLALPFGWDHDIIASVGSSYAHGGLPFVDSWDIKGPASYLPFALVQILFGPTMWGIRLLDIVVWAVAGFCLCQGVARLTTWRVGVGVALVTYLWIASAGWFFTAVPESWVAASCILAIVPMLSPSTNLTPSTVALSGFLIAWTGLVKPFYLAFGLAPFLSLALSSELALRRRGELLLALVAGALLPTILVWGYFGVRGGLSQAIEAHFLYPLSTYAGAVTGWSTTYHGVVAFLKGPPIFIGAPFVLLGIWFYKSQIRILATLLAWLGIALICVAIQAKYWIYHWFPAYPPLFILGALGAFALLQAEYNRKAVRAILALCSALILAAVLERPLQDVVRFANYSVLKHDWAGYNASYSFRLYNAADEIAMARYIAARSAPQQKLFIWGSDALYYLTDRPNPTRFTFLMPLTMPGPYRAPYRAEVIRELKANPPTYFVTGIAWDGLSKATTDLADFPAMASFLGQGYSLEKSIGILDLYRRRGDAHTAAIHAHSQRARGGQDIPVRLVQ